MGEIAWVGFSANDQSRNYWHVMFCSDGIKLFIQKSCIILWTRICDEQIS